MEQPLTREQIRQKLRNKIANARQPLMTQKQYNKMVKKSKKEMKKLKKDSRITDEMLLLYDKLNNEFTLSKVPSPSEILNNVELAKKEFTEYLRTLISKCKELDISQQTFEKDYLNSEYTRYLVMVAGMDIVPESLRSRINFNREPELPQQRIIDRITDNQNNESESESDGDGEAEYDTDVETDSCTKLESESGQDNETV